MELIKKFLDRNITVAELNELSDYLAIYADEDVDSLYDLALDTLYGWFECSEDDAISMYDNAERLMEIAIAMMVFGI